MRPLKKTKISLLDKMTYVAGIGLPLLTIPQAITIYTNKSAAGVSLITWAFYLLSSSMFAVFGILHKEKLLIVTYIPFVLVELAIVVGILVYR